MDSSLVITISIALAAVAFVALVIFLIVSLISLTKSLKRTEVLLDNTNDVAKNVSDKLHTFDPLFERVEGINEAVERKHEECTDEENVRRREIAVSVLEFVEWGLTGLVLALQLKKKK